VTEPAQMSDGELLVWMGLDAIRWAGEFVRRHPDADEGEMQSWFASSIMAGVDAGRRQACPHIRPCCAVFEESI